MTKGRIGHLWDYLLAELRLTFRRAIPPYTIIECERVLLDGMRAEYVAFMSCDIVYRGGPVQIGVMKAIGCKITMEGAASNTMAFLRAMMQSPGGKEQFRATFPELWDGVQNEPEQARGCATKVIP